MTHSLASLAIFFRVPQATLKYKQTRIHRVPLLQDHSPSLLNRCGQLEMAFNVSNFSSSRALYAH